MPYNEVSSILRTHDNQMWISMFGGGVCKIQTENKKFGVDRMEAVRSLYKTISIRNVFYAGDDEYWMGIIGFGMILYNARTHTIIRSIPISRICLILLRWTPLSGGRKPEKSVSAHIVGVSGFTMKRVIK